MHYLATLDCPRRYPFRKREDNNAKGDEAYRTTLVVYCSQYQYLWLATRRVKFEQLPPRSLLYDCSNRLPARNRHIAARSLTTASRPFSGTPPSYTCDTAEYFLSEIKKINPVLTSEAVHTIQHRHDSLSTSIEQWRGPPAWTPSSDSA